MVKNFERRGRRGFAILSRARRNYEKTVGLGGGWSVGGVVVCVWFGFGVRGGVTGGGAYSGVCASFVGGGGCLWGWVGGGGGLGLLGGCWVAYISQGRGT